MTAHLRRTVLFGLAAAVVLAASGRGALAVATALDVGALPSRQRLYVVAALVAAPVLVAAVAFARGVARRRMAAYVAPFGLSPTEGGADGFVDGALITVTAGAFDDEKAIRPVWIVLAHAQGLPPMVLSERAVGLPRYATSLPDVPLPPDVAATFELRAAAPDRVSPALIRALFELPGVRQARVDAHGARVLVTRPLARGDALRRALVLARQLAGKPLRDVGGLDVSGEGIEAKGPPRALYGVALALHGFVVIALGTMSPNRKGYEDIVLARARSCTLAHAALGAPIERTQLGLQSSSQVGRVRSSTVLVHGPKGEGSIAVEAYARTRGTDPRTYPFHFMRLEAGGDSIELLSCARISRPGLARPRRLVGKLASRVGAAPAGASCTIDVGPVGAGPECRAEVRCADAVFFGATPETGFTPCYAVGDRGRDDVVLSDFDRGVARPEPTLELDTRTGLAVLSNGARIELASTR